jgi:5-formyltetrahydrofolate cyclo-ligase
MTHRLPQQPVDDATSLRRWRKDTREALIAQRVALDAQTVAHARSAIEALLEHHFPDLDRGVVAFCWPIRNEFDARHLVARLRARGAISVLPVVIAPRQPLEFREWHPGVPLAMGALDIPYPAAGPPVVPDTVLLPMNGFDRAGFRLGYGAGFFDRTLAALARKPRVIGIAYAFAELATIHPQPHDIPMDFLVTEQAAYRRGAGGLVAL